MFFRVFQYIHVVFHVPLVFSNMPYATLIPGYGVEKDPEVWCKFQPSSYDCKHTGSLSRKYYFDTKLGDCKSFIFGTCEDNRNQFKTKKDCQDSCLGTQAGSKDISGNVSAKIYCRMQPDFGVCNDYYPMFYFHLSSRSCRGFSYSGCGGNLNRFPTSQICSTVCGKFIEIASDET